MNQSDTYIYAPHLYLFAFNLIRGQDVNFQTKDYQDNNWITKQYQEIILNFPEFAPEFTNNFKIREDKPDKLLFSLLGDKQERLYLNNKSGLKNEIIDQILISPKQIKDSQSLELVILKKQESTGDRIKIEELEKFNPHNCLEIDTYLGKTLLFHCFIDPQKLGEIDKIAEDCLGKILPQKQLPLFSNKYQLFGANAFIYGDFKSNQTESYTQVILLFFTAEINSEKYVKAYLNPNFNYLLLHFHKIVTGYLYGKQVYTDLDKYRGSVGQILKALKDGKNSSERDLDLDSLKSQLRELLTINLEYSQSMRRLESHLYNLEVNLANYKINLENLQINTDDSLEYFQYIQDKHLPLLQQELATKLKSISQGLTLTQEAVSIIRALIEIDQAKSDRYAIDQKEKSDRRLQITLTALGIGIGVGGIIASSSGQWNQDNPIYLPWQPQADLTHFHPFTIVVIVSVLVGVSSGLITKYILGLFLNSK